MNGAGIPRPILLWGLITVGISFLIMALTATAIVVLYRTGTWTRDQLNLFGPIAVVAAVAIPNLISLLVLRRLAKGLLASQRAGTRD